MVLHIFKNVLLVRVLVFVLGFSTVLSDLARLRLDGGRIVTSSTLKWVPGTGSIPHHSIPVTEDDVSTVWCRAQQHGTLVGGSFHAGICSAPFLDQVLRVSEGYEILVSINGSARVKVFPWDKYNSPPVNAIASSEKQKQFLAFDIQEDGILQAGYMIPKERRVHIVNGEKVRKSDNAYVIAEDEPVRYELQAVSLDKQRKLVSNDTEVLREIQLSNEGTANQLMVEDLDIPIKHLIYWGQVKGTLVGRKARIYTPKPEEETQDITWGVQNEFENVHSQFIEYDLPPGTMTNVKIIGTVRKTESPYVGSLTAFYADGTRLSRVIEGLHMDERLISLHAEYSSPYFIHNNTKLDIKERIQILYKSTTTTTTTTTTSTTTTISTTPEPPWVSMVRPEEHKTSSLENPNGREVRDHEFVSGVLNSVPQTFLVILCLIFTTFSGYF